MKAIIMVGPSGAGKSSYVREHFKGAVVIDYNSILESVAAAKKTTTSDVRITPVVNHAVEQAFLAALNRKERLVVVDHTNIRTKDRKIYMMLARNFGYEVELHIMGMRQPGAEPPSEEALSIYAKECWEHNPQVPISRIIKQAKQQRLPSGVYRYDTTTRYTGPLL